MNTPLIFTARAAAKVLELIEEEGNDRLKLRVYVTGGGCSGFQYGFKFDETIYEDDSVIESEDEEDEGGDSRSGAVQLLVDPISLHYLMGAEIDYKEDITGFQFIIRNPNAKTTCGCGSSFST
jgi:iron-sulfur cluster insertion protein